MRGGLPVGVIALACALHGQVALSQTLPSPPVSPAPVVDLEYDANGNLTRRVQASLATVNTYDPLDRVQGSTNPGNGLTQLGYNGREDLTQVTDPRSLVTQYPRNGLGDATQLISPDTGTATHSFDAAGNLKIRTDSRGVLATHTYDALNRLTRTVYSQAGSASLTHQWFYDQTGASYANGIGRLTSALHPEGSSQYSYDPQGRVLTELQRVKPATGANPAYVNKTVTYAYDAAGNIASIVYPSGRKLSIAYSGGQPSALSLARNDSAAATTLLSAIQWEPFGGLRSWQWQMASGTQLHERRYDAWGRVVRYRLGNLIRDLSYDTAGRITAYTHYDAASAAPAPLWNQTFEYDSLGRIAGITLAGAAWVIVYDANGNRTRVTLNGVHSDYVPAATSNRLASTTNPTRSFGFDAAGNTIADGAGIIAVYDLAGRMATLAKAGVTATYTLDGMGKRVRKVDSSGAASTVVFVYDQRGQLLGEYDSAGAALREYVWLGATPVAVFVPNPLGALLAPLVYYIHADHLDAPRAVVDKNGALRWRWIATDPFGTSAPQGNPQGLGAFTLPLRLPGQYADAESGLNYNFFRDYDPGIGRFVQSDPIGLAGGINAYAYAGGNPVSYIDSDGRLVVNAGLAGLGAVIGGASGAIGTLQKCGSWREVAGAAVMGALFGATAGATLGFGGSIGVGAAAGYGGDLAGTMVGGGEIDLGGSTMAGVVGAWGGGVGAALGRIGLSATKSNLLTGVLGLMMGLQYNKASGAVDDGCTCKK